MEAAAVLRRAGALPHDLTESNPTRCGLGMEGVHLLPPLSAPSNLSYRAEPFGPIGARQSIADTYYAERGCRVDPEHIVLTASTSEAYGFLFRLLCEPGDQVLVPTPSYPLFDLLATLNDVELRPYLLRFHGRWEVDFHALEAAITPRTRAIVVVHPNNPTGSFTTATEREQLFCIAHRHSLPLLIDEVFLDYALEVGSGKGTKYSFATDEPAQPLTFVMSGLSKVLALPQMKLAWTVVRGPEALRHEALRRLEFIADTYLSVAAPAANAVAAWLTRIDDLQGKLRARLEANLASLDCLLHAQTLVSRLAVEGGWSVLLRIPALVEDHEAALSLLQTKGVLVHPGSFFGLPPRGWFVLSLLPPEPQFEAGIAALLQVMEAAAAEVHPSIL